MSTINLSDYATFCVQIQTEGRWRNWDFAQYTRWETALRAAKSQATETMPSRIWGNHKTAKGGVQDRVVWDSRFDA